MKFSFPISLGFAFLLSKIDSACNQLVIRREIRDLSARQRTAYFDAINKLHTPGNDIFTKFCSDHFGNVPEAHGVPAFFPWHRYFLREYEKALQAIDRSIVLPYWDWSRDSQAPERSPILSNSYMGGNGRRSDRCVTTGTFANWRANVPNRHCLRRDFNSGSTISSFYSTEAVEAIISRSRSFDSLRTRIEGGPHGAVHTGIGGSNGDMTFMYSPNDPLFYLHHAFVDLLWSEWQTRNPSIAQEYNGGSVRVSDIMVPFGAQVRSVLKTTDLCYTYPRFGTSLPQSLERRDITSSLSDFIKNICNGAPGFERVDHNDRTTRRKLRVPKPLPEHYILNNKLDLNQVRIDEAILANLTMALNTVPGFVPVSDI